MLEYLGADTLIVDAGEAGRTNVRVNGSPDIGVGEVIGIRAGEAVHFFDEEGRAIR